MDPTMLKGASDSVIDMTTSLTNSLFPVDPNAKPNKLRGAGEGMAEGMKSFGAAGAAVGAVTGFLNAKNEQKDWSEQQILHNFRKNSLLAGNLPGQPSYTPTFKDGGFVPLELLGFIKKDGGPLAHNPNMAGSDKEFQKWYSKNTLEGQSKIPYSDTLSYDYYSFFKDKRVGNIEDHFPDTYKRPNHPTFSNESIYSTPEKPGGSWKGETYSKKGKFLYSGGGSLDINDQKNTTYYPTGGTHASNPHNGIPIGKDALTEQGEFRYDSKTKGSYIFSARF